MAGDHILPLLDVLANEDFRLIDCRHEQAAVHMADAWGRMTGQLGVTAVTTPGHANAIPGLANAMSTESPVLNIAGSADMKNYARGIMQEIDQVNMAKPVTKGAWLVHEASRIPDFVALAARTSFEGRRGPTHLTIPVDVQSNRFDEHSISWPTASATGRSGDVLGGSEEIVKAVRLLEQAKRPLVIASTPAAYGDWTKTYEEFIELTKFPFMTEEAARGIVSDDHPYCFGFFDLSQHQTANLIREADCILLLGKMIDFTIGYGLAPIIRPDAKVIQIDPFPDH